MTSDLTPEPMTSDLTPESMTFVAKAQWWTWVGLAASGLGMLIVLLAAWIEYLTHPGVSFVDAYWTADQAWVRIGAGLAVGGASLAVMAGTVATLARGDWVRRLLALAALGTAALWWAILPGWMSLPSVRYDDPITLAQQLPVMFAILLVAPALAIAVAALAPPGPPPPARPRLRKVHPPQV